MLSKCITFWYTCITIWYLKFLDKNKIKAEMDRSDKNIQVLSKAFHILKIIKEERDVKISLGKIAKISNLPRSTVQRIVNSLVKENFLSQSKEKGIIIGNEIYKLAATNSYDVVRSLSPIINALSNKTRETVDLSILKDNHMLLLDRVLGTYRLGVNSKIGLKLPMSTTASGKSALSLLDVEKVKEFLENESQSSRRKDVNKLKDEIAKAGINGIAYDFDENNDGISAVGSSFIIDNNIYSISIPVPSHRFNTKQKELEKNLKEAIEKVKPVLDN